MALYQCHCDLQELSVSEVVGSHEPVRSRSSTSDVRPGDQFVFRIQEPKSPLGSIWLEPHRPAAVRLRDRVMHEIKRAFDNNRLIRGRILNATYAGHAVGIAGFVADLPLDRSNPRLVRKLGALQDFVIMSIAKNNVIQVAHPGYEAGVRQARASVPYHLYSTHRANIPRR